MVVDPVMSALIEQSLRGRGVRYFRGHHDGEFFFILDLLGESGRSHLHVHLLPGAAGSVTVHISGDRFYPVSERDHLTGLAGRCAALSGVGVEVHDSSDPELVGVLVTAAGRPAGAGEVTALIDAAVDAAAEFSRHAGKPYGPDRTARRSA